LINNKGKKVEYKEKDREIKEVGRLGYFWTGEGEIIIDGCWLLLERFWEG